MAQLNHKELRDELHRLEARKAEIETALKQSSLASALDYPGYSDPVRLTGDGGCRALPLSMKRGPFWSQGNLFPDYDSARAEAKCREIMTKLRRLARASRERKPDAAGVLDVPVASTIASPFAFANGDDADEALYLIGEDNLKFLAENW